MTTDDWVSKRDEVVRFLNSPDTPRVRRNRLVDACADAMTVDDPADVQATLAVLVQTLEQNYDRAVRNTAEHFAPLLVDKFRDVDTDSVTREYLDRLGELIHG